MCKPGIYRTQVAAAPYRNVCIGVADMQKRSALKSLRARRVTLAQAISLLASLLLAAQSSSKQLLTAVTAPAVEILWQMKYGAASNQF